MSVPRLIPCSARKNGSRGFSLLELFVVVALVAILAAVVAGAMLAPNAKSRDIACLNNLRQLGLGWFLYSGDNADKLVRTGGLDQLVSDPTDPAGLAGGPKSQWVLGNVAILPDATNTLLLQAGLLYPYVKSPGAYKCPADRTIVGGASTVRSVSINSWMNPIRDWNSIMGYDDKRQLRVFRKQTDLLGAAPARFWLLIDEASQTLNDGWFVCDPNDPSAWRDLPARHHRGAGGLSFADGHAELRKWRDPLATSSANTNAVSPDLPWLQQRTTLRNSGSF